MKIYEWIHYNNKNEPLDSIEGITEEIVSKIEAQLMEK